jgi:hypothetical protein
VRFHAHRAVLVVCDDDRRDGGACTHKKTCGENDTARHGHDTREKNEHDRVTE